MVTLRTAFLLAVGTLVGFGAMLGGVEPWAVVTTILASVIVVVSIDLHLAVKPSLIKLRRAGDRTVRLGETATVELVVHNGDDSHGRLLVRDTWVPSAGASPFSHKVSLGSGERAALTTTLRATRRGDRPAVRVTIRSFGPMGLAFRQADQSPQWTLRVLPRFESRKYLPEKMAKLRQVEGLTAVRGRGQGTEFDTLREYVPGDDVRSIDWRATARRNDVMLRTWRPERSRRVVCVLDTGRTSAVRVGDEPRLDAAIDAALLLAAVAQEAGDQVDLLAADHQIRAAVSGVGGRNLLPRLVNALAPLHPDLVETDFEQIISEVLRRERKRSLVVIFTALEPGALGEGLLPILPKLVARHQVLVAAVHDPALQALATTPLDGADSAYSIAAGVRALAERRKISSALSRSGVDVLDCAADVFASQVTDAYLALKAAGRL
ncbi:DUF58 domain-containing protein [Allorhizocola rhizosphaerae]|uniref:DUF58 domain-containing protein n=1 Tax=Allorhizocola rhizosphaerae TaxID=1872709 RepID=UPI000E3B63A5|nr:DUF58 domain-containing protein [Allorhizocola rhizosphaerae]